MRHFVLIENQKIWFENFKLENAQLFPCFADVVPVPIQNGLYVVPEACLTDPDLAGVVEFLTVNNHLQNVELREVAVNEFIIYEI